MISIPRYIARPFSRVDRTHPINRGCVGWWAMYDGAGSKLQDLIGTNHATQSGTPAWNDTKRGKVVTFDGSTDYYTTQNVAQKIGLPFSLSCTVRASSTTDTFKSSCAFGNVSDDNHFASIGFRRYSTDGPYARFAIRTGNPAISASVNGNTVNVQDGNYHLITGVSEGLSSHKLYVDGKLEATDTTTLSGASFSSFAIGSLVRTTVSQYFWGDINNVRVWNRALTASEVLSLWTDPWAGLKQEVAQIFSAPVTSTAYRDRFFFFGPKQ